MKARKEYFLMVVFTLILNRVNVFANFMSNLNKETQQGLRGKRTWSYGVCF